MTTLQTAFETIRDWLNTKLVDEDDGEFANYVSLYPKHPEFVASDQEFPYFCMEYAGETPAEAADQFWQTSAQENGNIRIWVVVGESASDSLSVDLLAKVAAVRRAIIELTADRTECDFRCRVSVVDPPEYEPQGRWAIATLTVIIGAYDV